MTGSLRCLLLTLALTVFGIETQAQIVTTWNLTVTSRYNYAAGAYDAFTPFTGTLTITSPAVVTAATDYGTTTITQFGGLLGTAFDSPVTALIGNDPYGSGVAGAYNSYTFPNVSDYGSEFIEQFAAQRNTYHRDAATSRSWTYHLELRATLLSPSRGGSGAADYAFTPLSVQDLLQAFQASGGEATFNESFSWYDETASTYLDGFSWSGTATLVSMTTVPEPSTAALLIGAGALCLAAVRRRACRRRK